MPSLAPARIAGAVLVACLSGCGGLFTQHAVTAFVQGLEAKDLDQLKAATTADFAEKALRLPEAVEDIRLLRLPTESVKVVAVTELGPNRRQVDVEAGDSKKPIQMVLQRAGRASPWVVDDVILTQQKGDGDKVLERSVTDQMNLLLTVRELFNDWQTAGDDEVLATVTPELQGRLRSLTPAWRKQVLREIVGSEQLRSFRPEARLQDDRAVVALNRPQGLVTLDFKLHEGRWLLDDAAWTSAGENEVGSLQRLCRTLHQARSFLEAYAVADKAALKELAAPSLYDRCLVAADLQHVPLPVMELATRPFEVRQHVDRSDVLFELDDITYTLNLVAPDAPRSDRKDEAQRALRVEEVTLYEREAGQIKRLSVVFLAQAVVEVYAEALAVRDITQLRQLSTEELNARVWTQFPEDVLEDILLPEIEQAAPQHLSSVFLGATTEVTVMQGDRALTYVLHAGQDGLLVHDVLMPVLDRPNSLAKHLELLAPITEFALGYAEGDRDRLLAASGNGLDRIVWDVVDEIPEIGVDVARALAAPVEGVHAEVEQALVRLSDRQTTARVHLVKERGRFVVEDVEFATDGEAPGLAMLQAMRQTIAREMQSRNARRIVPVNALEPADRADRVLQPL